MNQKNDGGAAFPEQIAVTPTGDTYSGSPGMTLRDYFAAKAMQGLMADPTCEWSSFEIATAAYVTADAMLAVRGAQ